MLKAIYKSKDNEFEIWLDNTLLCFVHRGDFKTFMNLLNRPIEIKLLAG